MTLQEFINKYKGKHIDFDGSFGAQCMDLYRQYVKEVWNVPQTPWVQGAFQVFSTLPPTFEKFTQGEIKPGDVIVWNQKFGKDGHIAVVTESKPLAFTSFEQNNPKGSAAALRSHNYGNLIGWFRPKTELAKTFMAITVVANNNTWTNLPGRLQTLKEWFLNYSGNKFEPVFDIKYTSFTNIPKAEFAGKECIDVNWYRANITPLATGQATLFLCNPEDYPSSNAFGYMTWGDPGKPVRIEVMTLENDNTVFEERAYHEICHALLFLTGQEDRVHDFLYQNPPKWKELIQYVDQRRLQEKLVTIH